MEIHLVQGGSFQENLRTRKPSVGISDRVLHTTVRNSETWDLTRRAESRHDATAETGCATRKGASELEDCALTGQRTRQTPRRRFLEYSLTTMPSAAWSSYAIQREPLG